MFAQFTEISIDIHLQSSAFQFIGFGENDRKRITRILEIYHTTGKTKTELEIESRKEVPYNYHIFVLSMDREILYERINRRVDMMIEQGLIEEVQRVTREYDSFPTAMQGLGYKEVVEYLENKLTKEFSIERWKTNAVVIQTMIEM